MRELANDARVGKRKIETNDCLRCRDRENKEEVHEKEKKKRQQQQSEPQRLSAT